MAKTLRLKVYGNVKGEVRIKRRGHYFSVIRDKFGRFKSFRKWSQKRPNRPEHYEEKYVEARTGKEARQKVAEEIEKEQWIKKDVMYW